MDPGDAPGAASASSSARLSGDYAAAALDAHSDGQAVGMAFAPSAYMTAPVEAATLAGVAAEAAEREATALWQRSPDLLVVLDADGIIVAANPAWEASLGRAPAVVAGRTFIELLHSEDRTRANVDLTWVR